MVKYPFKTLQINIISLVDSPFSFKVPDLEGQMQVIVTYEDNSDRYLLWSSLLKRKRLLSFMTSDNVSFFKTVVMANKTENMNVFKITSGHLFNNCIHTFLYLR